MLTRSHSSQKENIKSSEQDTKMSAAKEALTIEDLMREICEGNKRTDDQLKEIDNTLKDNKKPMEDYISKNDETVRKLQTELETAQGEGTSLKSTVKDLEGAVNTLTADIEAVKLDSSKQKTTLHKLEKNDKNREDKKRRANIIIEGLKEDSKLHPRLQVNTLLADIGVNIHCTKSSTI